MTPDRSLIIFMRLTAVMAMLAVVAVFMPLAWMDAIHRQLGLGPLPSGPLVEYLARSLSAFYVLHGALLWFLSRDIARHLAIIQFVAVTMLAGGVGLAVLDQAIALPMHWRLVEGPVVMALGGTMSRLAWKCQRQLKDQRLRSMSVGTPIG